MKNDYSEKSDHYFSHIRFDVIDQIEKHFSINEFQGKRCLEIGCGGGVTAKYMKDKYQISEFIGIEYVKEIAEEANERIDKCYSGRAEDVLINELKGQKFDFIFFMDVLEHLYDPWGVFDTTINMLNENGVVVASIPNAAYYEFVGRIIFDKFEYNPNGGIMDSTHIRWFTKHTILNLFNKLDIKSIYGKTVEFNRWYIKPIYFFLKIFFKRFFILQYIVIGRNDK